MMNRDTMKRVRERHPNYDNLPDYDKKAVVRAEEKRIRKEQRNDTNGGQPA